MSDDTKYTEDIRKLTTAAEQDDAVTAGKILAELGPEQWTQASKDMIKLNRQDWGSHLDINIPLLSVELEKSGTKETLTVIQQPTRDDEKILPVAEISEDITGRNIGNPIDPSKDLVRQLTTAAEDGDAVTAARILKVIGTDKWGQVTKDMLTLNHEDRKKAADDPKMPKIPAHLSVTYKKDGTEETIRILQHPENQFQLPLVKVTDRK